MLVLLPELASGIQVGLSLQQQEAHILALHQEGLWMDRSLKALQGSCPTIP